MQIEERKFHFIWIIVLIVIMGIAVVFINDGAIPKFSKLESKLNKLSAKLSDQVEKSTKKLEKIKKEIIKENKKETEKTKKIEETKENLHKKEIKKEKLPSKNLNCSVLKIFLDKFSDKDMNFFNTVFKEAFAIETGCKVEFTDNSDDIYVLKITNTKKILKVLPNTVNKACEKCLKRFSAYFTRDDFKAVLKDKFGWSLEK